MAGVHNELRRSTNLQAAYLAALGERRGDFAGIERAGETLTPIINLWTLPEWAYLRDEQLRWQSVTAAAVAARFSEVQVVNPAGSGLLCVVERLRANATCQLAVEDLTAILADVSGLFPRDGRLKKPGSVIRVASGTAAALLAGPRWSSSANADIVVPLVLTPGRLVRVQHITANTAIQVAASVRIRTALPGELE